MSYLTRKDKIIFCAIVMLLGIAGAAIGYGYIVVIPAQNAEINAKNQACIDAGYDSHSPTSSEITVHGQLYLNCYKDTVKNGYYNRTNSWIPYNATNHR